MMPEAVLLSDPAGGTNNNKIARLLGFFGVPCRKLSASEFLAEAVPGVTPARSRLFCSADAFLHLLKNSPGQAWNTGFHSAFIYAGVDAEALQKLGRISTGDERPVAGKINH